MGGWKGNKAVDDVASAEFKDREFEIGIGDSLDMAVADWLKRRVPLDSHF